MHTDSDTPPKWERWLWEVDASEAAEEREGGKGLGVGKIVRAGIALADDEGLEGVSVRKLAQRLSVSTMAAYRHISSRDEVIAAIGEKNLVDVRSPDEFSGKILAPAHLPQEQSQRAGHIPTAISVPWSKAANEDGTFKSDDDLAKLYAEAGLDGDKLTIAYCRIGERSSHTWFVLQELLGHKNVKNYDGSWTEYGSLVGAPIELGS